MEAIGPEGGKAQRLLFKIERNRVLHIATHNSHGLKGIGHVYKLYLRHMALSLFRSYGLWNVECIYLIVYPVTLQFMHSMAWLLQ